MPTSKEFLRTLLAHWQAEDAAAARALLPDAPLVTPYAGARPMLHVLDTTDSARICALFAAVAADLPAKKPRKK